MRQKWRTDRVGEDTVVGTVRDWTRHSNRQTDREGERDRDVEETEIEKREREKREREVGLH